MRVLQLNAVYKTKSTGRIVYEMHHYFMDNGIDSYVAYATENTANDGDAHVFKIGNWLDHKIHAVEYRIDHMQGCHSSFATKKLLHDIQRLSPDVVVTHNLHSNCLHVPKLLIGLKKLNIPIVMCLHDCWFLTGGCYHYTVTGCQKWISDECKNCSVLGKAAHKKWLLNSKVFEEVNPTIVATSKWIEKEANKSLLGTRSSIHMIYDWVDAKTFYPRDRNIIRNKLGIGTKTMILGVATFWSANKGYAEVVSLAKAKPEATIVLVGNQDHANTYPDNVITIPFTESKDELAEYYSAADVFFNPSKQETFGLVSAEALSCGTPIVVFNTTACPEFVEGDTGEIMENAEDIVTAVEKVIKRNESIGRDAIAKICCDYVNKNFNFETNLNSYIELFKSLK